MKFAILYFLLILASTYADPYQEVKTKLSAFYGKFVSNVTIDNTNHNTTQRGKLIYEYPSRLNFTSNTGEVIASNGLFVWAFNPKSRVCIKQDLNADSLSGGIISLLKDYTATKNRNQYIFINPNKYYSKIILLFNGKLLQKIDLVRANNTNYQIQFNDFKIGVGFPASKFNFKPPTNAQIIENPINK